MFSVVTSREVPSNNPRTSASAAAIDSSAIAIVASASPVVSLSASIVVKR